MNKIQEAIDTLLANNEITKEEYEMVKKAALPSQGMDDLLKVLKSLAAATTKPVPTGFQAGLQNIISKVRTPLLITAGAGAAGVAVKELVVDPILSARRMNNSFSQMQEKVPQLAEKDQEKLRDYFGVIKTFSPKAASNPLVAGHLVNKMMEFGGVDHKLVQDLSSIESGLAKPSILQSAGEMATGSMLGPKMVSF